LQRSQLVQHDPGDRSGRRQPVGAIEDPFAWQNTEPAVDAAVGCSRRLRRPDGSGASASIVIDQGMDRVIHFLDGFGRFVLGDL